MLYKYCSLESYVCVQYIYSYWGKISLVHNESLEFVCKPLSQHEMEIQPFYFFYKSYYSYCECMIHAFPLFILTNFADFLEPPSNQQPMHITDCFVF